MTTRALAAAKSLSAQYRPSTPGRLKSGAAAPSANVGGFSAARKRLVTSTAASDAMNERFMAKCYAAHHRQQGGLRSKEKPASPHFHHDPLEAKYADTRPQTTPITSPDRCAMFATLPTNPE